MTTPTPKGFAVIDKERHRAISRLGGQAVHAAGRGHQWTKEDAIEAGRKGGIACAKRKRELARNAEQEAAPAASEASQ